MNVFKKIGLGILFVLFGAGIVSAQTTAPTVGDMVAEVESGISAGSGIMYTVVPIVFFMIAIGYVIWFARKGRSPR